MGVDEVGRGCLAGAVYAAAVILDAQFEYQHYQDSKLVSAERRRQLANEIKSQHRTSLGFASVDEIRDLNILRASLLAMKRAVEGLKVKSAVVLVDGIHQIPGLSSKFEQVTLIKGDQRVRAIAAASIAAKVARDEEMLELSKKYPHYGFEIHKGYGTAMHRSKIKEHGPCPEHRCLFKGVKEFWPSAGALG